MRRLLAMLLLAFGLLVPAAAYAQGDPVDDCIATVTAQEIQEKGIPSCRRVNGGEWEPYWEGQGPGDGSGGIVVLVVILGALWMVAPPVVAYKMAQRNGQSTGVALLIGVVGGWIGVLAVYLMGRSDTRQATHHAIDAMGPRVPAAGVEERLRALAALRDNGSISEEEYAAQRRAIIGGV